MKYLIAYLNAENELESSIELQAAAYEASGADGLYLYNFTEEDAGREEFLHVVRRIVKQIDIPVFVGCRAMRFEDVKKAYYTGAEKVVLRYKELPGEDVLNEVKGRFGGESLLIEFNEDSENSDGLLGSLAERAVEQLEELKAGGIMIKHIELSEKKRAKIAALPVPVYIRDSLKRNDVRSLLELENVEGVATNLLSGKSFMTLKQALREDGIEINGFRSSVSFEEMKKDVAGLVTVVVQDYRNNEVLMVAYMNEEAFNKTIETGKMTYYSRSRSELWVKGETSGHTQYVKSLSLDCDGDALLAKVKQIGAACHTGNRSCFYTEIVSRMLKNREPFSVFTDVYNVIIDRKKNPKEGSYTNYLFNKGIDKILKKCGEEAAEIIIAAKNPDKEEIKYEIADFLYHVMVLMAECGIDWEDVADELSHRK